MIESPAAGVRGDLPGPGIFSHQPAAHFVTLDPAATLQETRMSSRELKNKPLIEAIFEFRWSLQQKSPGVAVDPHYRLLLGRLFDRLTTDYPVHEQLETARIPDDLAGNTVQHRFRAAEGEWPLAQVGPGVFTVNDTSRYTWEDFRDRVTRATGCLFDSYPQPDALQAEALMIRYIDAIDLPANESDFYGYLRDLLKVSIDLPQTLFQGTGVEISPLQFHLQQSFRCESPAGRLQLRLAIGQRNEQPALIWETNIQSTGSDLPQMPGGFESWLDDAHATVNDWFFKMIDGKLLQKFRGDENAEHDAVT